MLLILLVVIRNPFIYVCCLFVYIPYFLLVQGGFHGHNMYTQPHFVWRINIMRCVASCEKSFSVIALIIHRSVYGCLAGCSLYS